MKLFLPEIDQRLAVRGTEIHSEDTPAHYLQKLARSTAEEARLACILSTDGILVECNPVALQGSGIQRDDIVGQPFWETFWWTVTPQAQNDLREAIASAARGESIHYDVE